MSKFKMSKNTEKKALLLVDDLRGCLEDRCYFVANRHLKALKLIIERHLRKEVKI